MDFVQARWKGWSGMAADRPACSAPLQHCEDRRGGLLDGLVRAATREMMMVSEHRHTCATLVDGARELLLPLVHCETRAADNSRFPSDGISQGRSGRHEVDI